ncbi:glycoside hydrolase family 28 protein [Arachidicoccus sp.]|uniref:glycoside hydrolase family 28 protein n=1 Tax=Arachidicoccus sp. TaxID=1872624 RepID=UPI003D1AC391
MNKRITSVLSILAISFSLPVCAQQNILQKDSIAMIKSFHVSMPALPVLPAFKKDTLNIKTLNAKGDGQFLNTVIINKAIAQISASGGGVVLIPGGVWLTGPLEMKSNVNLHLNRDAIVLFTKDKDQYHLTEGDYEGHRAVRNESPIYGENLENVAITGRGVIDGNGDVWRSVKKSKLTPDQWNDLLQYGGILSENKQTWYPSASYLKGNNTKDAGYIQSGKSLSDYTGMKDFFRPNLLVLKNCKNVLLENATFQNSPAWCLHLLMCENLSIKEVNIKNPAYAQNGDGMDIESCKNVLIEGNTLTCGDDGICIKSGRDAFGRERGMPTENVIVRGNVVYHAHGGFVIGSEMSGGANNIFVYDNSFMGTENGLRFKTTRGRGGIVSNIYISNIFMKDIQSDAILFDMYYMATSSAVKGVKIKQYPVTVATPQFKNFKISNVVCVGANRGIFVRGLPEMNIQDISFKNITLEAKQGVDIEEAKNIKIENLHLNVSDKNSLVKILNGQQLQFDGLSSDNNVAQIFSVDGSKSNHIDVANVHVDHAASKVQLLNGTAASSINFN